jgi:hypothetical protein
VKKKATEELDRGERHQALSVAVSIVLPAKCHLAIIDRHESMIGNRHTMSVSGQILQNLLRTAKGGLHVNAPVLGVDGVEKGSECIGVSQRGQGPVERKVSPFKGASQESEELSPKQMAQDPDR